MDNYKGKAYEKKDIPDYQQELTNKVMARIQEAIDHTDKGLKWEKPFLSCSEMPFNALTGERYRGSNIVSLAVQDFPDPRWLTYNQMGELSKQLKLDKPLHLEKGSKASYVVKVVPVYATNDDGTVKKDEQGKSVPVVDDNGQQKIGFKWYPVFNASQVVGLEPYMKPNFEIQPSETIKMYAEALVARTGLTVEHSGQGRAYYSPSEHRVHMPNPELFKSEEGYHSTFIHESIHANGQALGRKFGQSMNDPLYAKEELVAELGSMFTSIELNVGNSPETQDNNTAYLRSWLKTLQDDKTFIMKASNLASKATEFNIGHFNEYKQELAQKEEAKLVVSEVKVDSAVKQKEFALAM